MEFHRRFNQDGSCEIICVICFQTVGIAKGNAAAKEIEARHICRLDAVPDASASERISRSGLSAVLQYIDTPTRVPAIAQRLPLPLVSLTVALFLYALPTAVEWIVTRRTNPWVGSIILGDLVGCACLATIFRMPRTGVLLYVLLTGCEAFLYEFRLISATTLAWIVDIVPMLVVAGLIVRSRLTAALHQRALA